MKLRLAGTILWAFGCSPSADIANDTPVDFSGSYSLTVTNGSNGCAFGDWVEGQSSLGIPLVIEQQGPDASARVEGIPGALLRLLHGSNQYAGKVTGNRIALQIDGSISGTEGNCTFTWSNDVAATLEDDYIAGKLVYSRAHNNNPDCVAHTCETVQQLNGTRPPRDQL